MSLAGLRVAIQRTDNEDDVLRDRPDLHGALGLVVAVPKTDGSSELYTVQVEGSRKETIHVRRANMEPVDVQNANATTRADRMNRSEFFHRIQIGTVVFIYNHPHIQGMQRAIVSVAPQYPSTWVTVRMADSGDVVKVRTSQIQISMAAMPGDEPSGKAAAGQVRGDAAARASSSRHENKASRNSRSASTARESADGTTSSAASTSSSSAVGGHEYSTHFGHEGSTANAEEAGESSDESDGNAESDNGVHHNGTGDEDYPLQHTDREFTRMGLPAVAEGSRTQPQSLKRPREGPSHMPAPASKMPMGPRASASTMSNIQQQTHNHTASYHASAPRVESGSGRGSSASGAQYFDSATHELGTSYRGHETLNILNIQSVFRETVQTMASNMKGRFSTPSVSHTGCGTASEYEASTALRDRAIDVNRGQNGTSAPHHSHAQARFSSVARHPVSRGPGRKAAVANASAAGPVWTPGPAISETATLPAFKRQRSHSPSRAADNSSHLYYLNCVLPSLIRHPSAWPFVLPLDTSKLEQNVNLREAVETFCSLVAERKVITLTTVLERLQEGRYTHGMDVATDIRRIFAFCYTHLANSMPFVQHTIALELELDRLIEARAVSEGVPHAQDPDAQWAFGHADAVNGALSWRQPSALDALSIGMPPLIPLASGPVSARPLASHGPHTPTRSPRVPVPLPLGSPPPSESQGSGRSAVLRPAAMHTVTPTRHSSSAFLEVSRASHAESTVRPLVVASHVVGDYDYRRGAQPVAQGFGGNVASHAYSADGHAGLVADEEGSDGSEGDPQDASGFRALWDSMETAQMPRVM